MTSTPIFQGRWIRLGQAAWLVLVVLSILLWVMGSFGASVEIPTSCLEVACDPFALSAGDLEALRELNLPVQLVAGFFSATNTGIALSFFLIAGFIAWRKSGDGMGLLVSFTLVYLGAVFFTDSDDALWRTYPHMRIPLTTLGMIGYIAIMALLFHFPDGQFVPKNRVLRTAGWAVTLLTAPLAGTATRAGSLGTYPVVITIGLGLAAQAHRYRAVSGRDQRQQTKWVLFGLALSLMVMMLWAFTATRYPPGPPSVTRATALLIIRPFISVLIPMFPLTIAFSILRFRLWEVDVVINRALLYTLLTLGVLTVFGLTVGFLGMVFQSRENPLIAVLATGLVAVLFQPLRERLQQRVNRLVYGEQEDPLRALSKLGRHLETALAPEVVVSTMVDTIAKTMNVPYVAISLRSGERFNIAASRGEAQDKVMKLPLTYQGEMVGQLIVSRRRPGEPFRKVDMRLLETIAHQAGPAVRAVQLTTTLQQSRLRIVTAREEERRRLRRDLHDGLGATLAALHLEAGTLKKAIRNDPDAAEEFVETFRQEIRDSIDSIRHLVYELRPPQLDQLGLIDALRVLANRSSRPADHSRPRLQVDLVSLDPLPPLPAAVEVAAYRIVQEALTNVVQHAGASHCEVRLRIDRDLIVEVVDDGLGLVHTRKGEGGLGILSMRERAVELGGTCEVRLRPEGGTQVLASLPLPES